MSRGEEQGAEGGEEERGEKDGGEEEGGEEEREGRRRGRGVVGEPGGSLVAARDIERIAPPHVLSSECRALSSLSSASHPEPLSTSPPSSSPLSTFPLLAVPFELCCLGFWVGSKLGREELVRGSLPKLSQLMLGV